MVERMEGRKAGLKRGDATAIARELGLSVAHVTLVIRGLREPGAKLAKAIARKQRANARAEAKKAERAAREAPSEGNTVPPIAA